MLRADDGSYFAIDTTDGVVWRLQLEQEPPSKRVQRRDAAEDVLLRRIRVLGRYSSIEASAPPSAARTAHANSALVALGHLWVLHNNLRRRSQLVLIDLSSGKRHPTAIPLGGPNCHSAVFHRGDVLYLNSSIGGLARLRADGSQQSLWQAGPQKFAKGLAVVDDVAYFGVSDRSSAIARNWAQVDLVAVHVAPSGAGRWLWTRRLPSTGLVNSVSAPHVAPHGCTWRACSTRARWSTGSSTQAGSDGSEGAADTADDDGKAHLPRREQWARILGLPAHEPHAGIVAAPSTAPHCVTSRCGCCLWYWVSCERCCVRRGPVPPVPVPYSVAHVTGPAHVGPSSSLYTIERYPLGSASRRLTHVSLHRPRATDRTGPDVFLSDIGKTNANGRLVFPNRKTNRTSFYACAFVKV